jgi:homocitrate synthase NifV
MKKYAENQIWLIDTTLRDGRQSSSPVFSDFDKITIARILSGAGVNELEAGVPAMGAAEQKSIKDLARLNLPCRLTSWCRAKRKDIEMAALCRTEGVHISFPVASGRVKSPEKRGSRILKRLKQLVANACSYFDYVSVGARDALKADPLFLEEFVCAASAYGVQRMRIADTSGIANPAAVDRLIRKLSEPACGMPLEFHSHSNPVSAAANICAAVKAGAKAISVTAKTMTINRIQTEHLLQGLRKTALQKGNALSTLEIIGLYHRLRRN